MAKRGRKGKGWPREPARHGLAAKGIRTDGAKAHAAMGKAVKLQQSPKARLDRLNREIKSLTAERARSDSFTERERLREEKVEALKKRVKLLVEHPEL